jgi:hypothetical protein
MNQKLQIIPISIRDANMYVDEYHRHLGSLRVGATFALAISDGEKIRGVALVGRPAARHLDNGFTLEVRRCCTDGLKNVCSMLYGAAWRVAREMGYRRLITYTRITEPGTSLKAAGWKCLGERKGNTWNMPSRHRKDTAPLQKYLWEAYHD